MADRNDAVTMSLEEAKILVMQGMKGDPGESPRINPQNNHWEVYDNDTEQWVDTGVSARGPKGDPGSGGEGGSLPEVDSSDVGKVLRVNSDAEWDVLDPPVGVPSYSGAQDGQVLTILTADGSRGMFWATPSTGLPDASASNTNKFLKSNGTSWVAASLPREVPIFRHCMVADEDAQVVEHTIQGYVNGDWTAVTGSYLAGAIDESGKYPVIMDYPVSYPRIYKPEQILDGTNISFRATSTNGTATVLIVPWNSSIATVYTKESDLPEVNTDVVTSDILDVGKVPTVMPSGGYGLLYPEPFEIPITADTTTNPTTYSTTASVEDILAHRKNLVVTLGNTLLTYDGYATSIPDSNPSGKRWGTFYFSARQISVGVEYIVSAQVTVNATGATSTKSITVNNYTNTLS